jgi:SSS family solute:Na+ symporter
MATIDWVIIVVYTIVITGIGLYFTKRASKSTTSFLLAGRSLPWFIAGTSMVAATFSCSTPLFQAGIVRRTGIYGCWLVWAPAIGMLASVFFFARLWRRTEAVTEPEFVIQRYETGTATKVLRIFKVFFEGLFLSCVVIANVTLAMRKILEAVLNLSDEPLFHIPFMGDVTADIAILAILGGVAIFYTTFSGLYVVYCDFFAFIIAMVGCIALAVIAYTGALGGEGLMAKLAASPDFKETTLAFFPDLTQLSLLNVSFILLISVSWWHLVPCQGFTVQRLLACKNEKHSFYAYLWYNICHFIVRPWPWLIVGILSIYYLPNIQDPEGAYPAMINLLLPAGLKGLIIVAMLAAYMSSVDSFLSMSSSYMVNDLYRPYLVKNKSQKHYVFASRMVMIIITILALLLTTKLNSIIKIYQYNQVILAGIGTVMVARWYWWRVNPYSEIAAIIASIISGNLLLILLPNTATADYFAIRATLNITIVAIVWVTVTFLTAKEPSEQTIKFYKKIRVAGPGWKKIRQLTNVEPIDSSPGKNIFAWLTSVIFIYSLLIGCGKLLFMQWTSGSAYMAAALISGGILIRILSKIKFM